MTKPILSVYIKAPMVLEFYGCLFVEKLSINCLPISVKYLPVPTNSENPSGNPKLIGAFRKPPIKIMFRKPPIRLEKSNNYEGFELLFVITGRKIVALRNVLLIS
jgi:hypothetical protein